MKRSLFHRPALAFVGLLALGEGATAATPAPGSGDFVVVAARRDTAVNNAQGAYQEDDPQLVGRLIHIDPSFASFDGDSAVCQPLNVRTQRLPAGALFRSTFPRGTSANYTRFAQPADFRLPIKASTPITATRFQCLRQSRHGDLWRNASIFSLGDGRAALLWPAYSFVLILKPFDLKSPVSPHFSCAKAATVTEKAICSDHQLASWDRSAASAYKLAYDNFDDRDQVIANQKAYLQQRERCGADKDCILGTMQTYTLNIAH